MAYLTGFVRSTLSNVVFGGQHANFPYTIQEPYEEQDPESIWSLHHGVRKSDQTKVTIFALDLTRKRDLWPLAKNAYKRHRTIRHPNLLTYLDGLETEDTTYIVTHPVVPLRTYLRDSPDEQLVQWGLYKIARAVQFLNEDCKFVHGNVRPVSVFVTPAGEWLLGGFEVLGSPVDPEKHLQTYLGMLPNIHLYCPPEIQNQQWSALKDNTIGSMDGWQYACLLYEIYNHSFVSSDQLAQPQAIPMSMGRSYRQLTTTNPTARWAVGRFLTAGTQPRGFFDNEFIRTNLFLENLSIKDKDEKTLFFQQLEAHVEEFPVAFSLHKVLPELLKSLEYAAGGPQVLKAVFKIGNLISEDDFTQHIMPTLVKLFALPDRALRFSLLESLPHYVQHLSTKTVNNTIYPHVAAGFMDTAPAIREQTVKALVPLAPKLSESTIQRDVVAALGKSIYDSEPGIRTNSLICLGKLVSYITQATHKATVVPLILRSLRDPFVHARTAALMAIAAIGAHLNPKDVSTMALPPVCHLLLDPEKPVRTQATKTLHGLLKLVEAEAAKMPDSVQSTQDATPRGEADGTLPEGWGGWAVSSLSRGITALGNTMVTAKPGSETVSPKSETASLPPHQDHSTTRDDPLSTGPGSVERSSSAPGVPVHPIRTTSSQAACVQNSDQFEDSGWGDLDDFSIEDDLAQLTTDTNNHSTKPNAGPQNKLSSKSSLMSPTSASSMTSPNANTSDNDDEEWDSVFQNKNLGASRSTRIMTQSSHTQTARGSSLGTSSSRATTLQQRRDERKLRLQQHREKKKLGLGATKLSTT
ncbi:Nuclear aminoacylation-dependent tRNA export pathway component [Dispira parvispora]|uniref:Nuclear aminoacylation-dependent tRNA export pathway component n=1 Tax=Dispira parvispora TaxID=1520584 RepID=A0A9W8E4J6_9FUNG|nr:Nuclear aminoacylation-dependent tRNA export pathway component [Dispira parvispora]